MLSFRGNLFIPPSNSYVSRRASDAFWVMQDEEIHCSMSITERHYTHSGKSLHVASNMEAWDSKHELYEAATNVSWHTVLQ